MADQTAPGSRPVVVVGAGMAAGYLAAELRRRGHAGRVTLVGAERVAPYDRPPLTKAVLVADEPVAAPELRPRTWYDEHDVTLLLGRRVTRIDRDRAVVTLDDGQTVAYADLVLATGGTPRLPPLPAAHLAGLLTVRTAGDAATLRERLDPGGRVVVVGAGFVGLEVAAAARARGCHVTVVELAPTVLGRACSPVLADAVARLHRRRGVALRTGVGCAGVAPGPRGAGHVVSLDDGSELGADTVVVGVGIAPETALAGAAGLATDATTGGVEVDDQLRATTDPRVSAVGDVASFPVARLGRRVRLESVDNAATTATHVAARLTGAEPPPYAGPGWTPTFWSDQYDSSLQVTGLAAGADSVRTVGEPDGPLSVYSFAGEALVAVESLDRPADQSGARRALREGVEIRPDDVTPDLDLRALVRRRRSLAGRRPGAARPPGEPSPRSLRRARAGNPARDAAP